MNLTLGPAPISMHPHAPVILLLAVIVGALAGTHAAIWGMYKDALHEGFAPLRFARSIMVGSACGALLQALLALPLPEPSALLLLFGTSYAAERGAVEVWKTFVRTEDQSKYFIPMMFSIGGVPVANGWLRLSAATAYVVTVAAGLALVSQLDHHARTPLEAARTALVGVGVGLVIAIGGAWKDAPKEGFNAVKFLRSPSVAATVALLLGRVAPGYLVVAVASIGFERAIVETWKKFADPLQPPGKFAGKPVTYPHALRLRRRFVPIFVAIWLAVLCSAAATVASARSPAPALLTDAVTRP